MSSEIIKVLDDLSKRFGVAIDWTNQNILPYLQILMNKYITYMVVRNIISIIFWILVIIISIFCYRCIKKHPEFGIKQYEYCKRIDYSDRFMCIALSIIAILVAFFMIFGKINNLTELLLFPEKAVFEYIQSYL